MPRFDRALRDSGFNIEAPLSKHVASNIYEAIVTENNDSAGAGRVSAYIPTLGQGTDDANVYLYASPFGGSTGKSTFGFFGVPTVGSKILVFHANGMGGSTGDGYWFSVSQDMPNPSGGGGISGAPQKTDVRTKTTGDTSDNTGDTSDNVDPRGENNPYVTPNKTPFPMGDPRNEKAFGSPLDIQPDADFGGTVGNDGEGNEYKTPYNSPPFDTIDTAKNSTSRTEWSRAGPAYIEDADRNVNVANQGTYSDRNRGNHNSSTQREARMDPPQAPHVYGMSTPGGSAIYMDDGNVGPNGEIYPNQVRLTTGSGAQVILDGTNDFIYMVNSSGSGWIEIGAGGEVMVYAKGAFSVRAEDDINLHSDANVNIQGKNVNVVSDADTNINPDGQFHLRSGGGQYFDSGGSTHIGAQGSGFISTSGNLYLNGPKASPAHSVEVSEHPDVQNHESTKLGQGSSRSNPASTRPSGGGGSVSSHVPSAEPSTRRHSANNVTPAFDDYKGDPDYKGLSGENGNLNTNDLTRIAPGHYLQKDAAEAYLSMVEAAKIDGITWSITDSYRDYATQVRLAREKGLYSEGGLAAKPGTSKHGWGLAVDLGGGANSNGTPQNNWLRANANRFQFFNIPREPWHWEYRGSVSSSSATKFSGKGVDKGASVSDNLVSDTGMTKAAASGISGNIMAESAFDSGAVEKGDSQGGRGWIQWTGVRREEFQGWSAANGLDWRSEAANYGYLKYEMKEKNHWAWAPYTPPHIRALGSPNYNTYTKITDPTIAAEYFAYGYERPKQKYLHLNRRTNGSQAVYYKMK